MSGQAASLCRLSSLSADDDFDSTFKTNVLVNSSGFAEYLPPGKCHPLTPQFIPSHISQNLALQKLCTVHQTLIFQQCEAAVPATRRFLVSSTCLQVTPKKRGCWKTPFTI